MNAELFRAMSEIAEDEGLMAKLVKYVKKLAARKRDETLMTKEEFFRRVDEAKKGPTYRMLPNEDLTAFLNRIGNDIFPRIANGVAGDICVRMSVALVMFLGKSAWRA